MTVACVLIPRFQLLAALPADRRRKGMTRPAALAPEPGAAQLVGEASGPAEKLGIRAGMRLGEALSRCPELALIPPDPERAERGWEQVLRRLEGIGAEVESRRAGEAFFGVDGLRGLWGGTQGVLARARDESGSAARVAAAPGRFCAYVAARQGAGESEEASMAVVPDGETRRYLEPLPITLLHGRLVPPGAPGAQEVEADDLPNELEQLGIATLGRLAALPRDAIADRFGRLGLHALRLAQGGDDPLWPRRAAESLAVELELPEASSGQQLERALELLVGRLLAHSERHARTVRALRLSARLAAGGGWRRRAVLRTPTADSERLLLALLPHLSLLPAPASVLRLEATVMGPATGEQLTLAAPSEQRRRKLSEAVRQARAAAGGDAVLRVLEVDPGSRIPERRDVLMPFPEEEA